MWLKKAYFFAPKTYTFTRNITMPQILPHHKNPWIRWYRRSPTFLLAIWFIVFLCAGTCLLTLPVAHAKNGPDIDIFTALFTTVSAFCVTGLVLVDTHDAFSLFGQAVILALMELGGIGVMTFASLAFSTMGQRFSLTGQAVLVDTLFQDNAVAEFRETFKNILKAVLGVQLLGVALLFLFLRTGPDAPPLTERIGQDLWSALFHSVSAFCNAGFSIYRDNLTAVADNPFFLGVIAGLVILGGLGHGVLGELYRLPDYFAGRIRRGRWISLNTRVVLLATGALLPLGAVCVGFSDYFYGGKSGWDLRHSVFHSIVARTAGFNSASLETIPMASCLFLCILMFIGGAPGSCAGGVKTNSIAIWLARVVGNLRHSENVNIAGYTIVPELVSKARSIMALSALWIVTGVVFLSLNHPEARLEALLFEQVSALGTVGLSMGMTPKLNQWAKIWIMASMIMGKFGPLTVALWVMPQARTTVREPEGKVMVG